MSKFPVEILYRLQAFIQVDSFISRFKRVRFVTKHTLGLIYLKITSKAL